MALANPWGLLALAAIPLVLYLHRRSTGERRLVPLVRLWAPGAAAARTEPRRWRLDAVLLVRVLIVASIALGLARPGWPTPEPHRRVLVIDASASMLAREAAGPRLDQALAAAGQVLDELPRSDSVLVLRAGIQPSVTHDFSEDRRSLRAAMMGLTAGETPKNLKAALQEAGRRLAGAKGTVHVFSDSRDGERLARLAAEAGFSPGSVRLHPVGSPADNLAIVKLAALPAPGSPLDHEVFVEIANFSRNTRAIDVALRAADGVRERRQLNLAPGQRQGAIFVTGSAPWIEAHIENAADALPVDDRAVLVLAEGPLRVLYASRGDPYLDAALRAHPRLRVRTIPADEFPAELAHAPPEAVAVIDGARVPPTFSLPALVFSTDAEASPTHSVAVTDWQRGHPILRQLDLGDVLVPSGAVLAAGPISPLIRSAEGTVARTSEEGGVRRVEIAFGARRSNLGQMPAFPVMVARALEWLAAGPAAQTLNLRAGETARFVFPAPGPREAIVRRPDGSTQRVPADGGRVEVTRTDLVGRYEVALGDHRAHFAINLLDRDESNLDRPRPASPSSKEGNDERSTSSDGWRDLSRWIFAVALQLLSVEIWLLQRRAQKAVAR